jgi:hypothetical protein
MKREAHWASVTGWGALAVRPAAAPAACASRSRRSRRHWGRCW